MVRIVMQPVSKLNILIFDNTTIFLTTYAQKHPFCIVQVTCEESNKFSEAAVKYVGILPERVKWVLIVQQL